MASGDFLVGWDATSAKPTVSAGAQPDTRNGTPCQDFDTTTQEGVFFVGTMPPHYSGGNLVCRAYWGASSATTGTIGWVVDFERVSDSQQDLDSDAWTGGATITATTVPGTSGFVDITTATASSFDSIAVGEFFRVRLRRDTANDNAAGDAELYFFELWEA